MDVTSSIHLHRAPRAKCPPNNKLPTSLGARVRVNLKLGHKHAV